MLSLTKVRQQNLAKLMKKLAEEQNIHTYKEIHEKYGVSAGYLSQVMNGTKDMGERFARKMEMLIGLPEFYLDQPSESVSVGVNTGIIGGMGNTQNNLTQNVSVQDRAELDEISANHYKDMPLLDIDMGVAFVLDPNALDNAIYDTAERVATFIPHSGRTFGIKNNIDITGVTLGTIRKSDILIIEPCITPRDNDLVLLCLDFGGANRGVIARLFVDLAGNRTVKHNDSPPEPMPENSLICGVVVEVKRRLLDSALAKARLNPAHNPLNTLEMEMAV